MWVAEICRNIDAADVQKVYEFARRDSKRD
jgi:hypothetical protein